MGVGNKVADEVAAGTTTECAATVTVTVTEAPAATPTECAATVTVTVTEPPAVATADFPETSAVTTTAANDANGANLQTFAGALGGVSAPAVTPGGRNFQVENNASSLDLNAALNRSCDVQKNQCATAANADRNAGFSVGDCETQAAACRALIR